MSVASEYICASCTLHARLTLCDLSQVRSREN